LNIEYGRQILVILTTNDEENIGAVEESTFKGLRFVQARQAGHNTGSVKQNLINIFYKIIYSVVLSGASHCDKYIN
jgi:hypothetical protein